MNSDYLTDEEYERYWFELGGMRKAISEGLGLTADMKILDVGTGWGFFAVEMAKQLKKGEIVGIDITSEDTDMARKFARDAKVSDIVKILRMDATRLSFADEYFDFAVSFLGMRDIHMTRGKEGVKSAVLEMIRVIKTGGKIALCITPPEDMEIEDQRIAVEVEGEVFGAKSLPKKFYTDLFRVHGVVLTKTAAYYTHKKLTVHQAMIELDEGIKITRETYGKHVLDFEEVWDRYGKKIENFGYSMYSKIIMLLGEK